MVAPHDANAHDPDSQQTVRTNPDSLTHDPLGSPCRCARTILPLACSGPTGDPTAHRT